MALWTVHKKDGAGDDFRLVRDGFHFWGLVLPLLWLLARGLWTAFLMALAARLLITAACYTLGVSPVTTLIANLVINLIVGFEGSAIQRWTLMRRDWRDVGAVSAGRRSEAEYRYVLALPPAAEPPPSETQVTAAPPGHPRSAPDALGLFGGA